MNAVESFMAKFDKAKTEQEKRQDNGPAVKDGVINYLSVSALQSADPETYAGCLRRWYYKYVMGKKEPKTAAQDQGSQLHSEIEQYLKTGEDVLGPIARAGKHLLPAPGPDLSIEADFGANIKAAIAARSAGALADEVRRLSGLTAGGIPMVGYIDVRHSRGEFVDEDGEVRPEPSEHGRVVEVIDHKSTSKIRETREGGRTIRGYAKTSGELLEAVQMIGYACVDDVAHRADTVRLSHIYYQTRNARDAKKVMALISVEDARRKWQRVDALARTLVDVAKETDVERVPGTAESCNSFKYGCPHRSYCSGDHQPVVNLLGKVNRSGEKPMGLFAKFKSSSETQPAASTSAPSAASSVFSKFKTQVDDPARRAEIEEHKKTLLEEDGKAVLGNCTVCGAALTKDNSSTLKDKTVKHIGCKGALEVKPGQVVPSDAPSPNAASAAMPLSKDKIETIEDPEIKARAEKHAADVTAGKPEEKAEDKAVVRDQDECAMSRERVELTDAERTNRKVVCKGCGREVGVRPSEKDGKWWATVTKHGKAAKAPAAAPAVAAPAAVTPVEGVEEVKQLVLYVDVAFERGPQPPHLEDYVAELATALAKEYDVPDIRFVSDKNNPLAYGNWRGALTVLLQNRTPVGEFQVRSSDEIAQVAIVALSSKCARVIRGK